MAIISDITRIVIEKPSYAVTEIYGTNIDTGKEIRLRAEDLLKEEIYIRVPKSKENVILQRIKMGPNYRDSFFVEDKSDPTRNLLIEMEKDLTGQYP